MILTNFLSMSSSLTEETVEAAYKDIIGKIRLPLQFFPVMMENRAGLILGFDHPLKYKDTSIILKEIVNVKLAKLSSASVRTNIAEKDIDDIIVLERMAEKLGYPVEYDQLNSTKADGERDIIPKILINDSLIYVENYDDFKEGIPFFWILGYVYPPLCVDSVGNPHYNFDRSIDYDTAEIDNALIYPIIAKAKALYYQDLGDIGAASGYDNLALQYINIYNLNKDNYFGSSFQTVGNI